MLRIEEEALSISQDQHQIQFSLTTPTQLIGQHKEIYSAFTNLITNAIRYTATGGSIHISWKNTHDGGACFSVRDSGIGIPSEDLPRITERFYRVDRGRSRETGGTGLGLAIVKHIAIRHQAQLEIQSEVGKGSTFSLIFPHTRVQA
jgi:two-component system phosphate regulon sensor histidine kinase PhoR